jgi:hypothetical protein
MSDFNGAYFVVGGLAFAAVKVRPQAVSSERSREETTAYFRKFFPQVPILLAVQSPDGRITFWGEEVLAKYLAKNAHAINWCIYSTD